MNSLFLSQKLLITVYLFSQMLIADIAGTSDEAVWLKRLVCKVIVQLIGPVAPHIAEELWQRLGYKDLLVNSPWPEYDPSLLIDDTVTIAVQVNGKLRGTIEVPRDNDKEATEAEALSLENVQRVVDGNPPRKVGVIPNKVVNVVI